SCCHQFMFFFFCFFFSSRRRHTRFKCDWSSDVCSSDLPSAAVHWTFQTPPPKVLTFAPENTTVDTTPVFIATFDQRVDADAVLRSEERRVGKECRARWGRERYGERTEVEAQYNTKV